MIQNGTVANIMGCFTDVFIIGIQRTLCEAYKSAITILMVVFDWHFLHKIFYMCFIQAIVYVS